MSNKLHICICTDVLLSEYFCHQATRNTQQIKRISTIFFGKLYDDKLLSFIKVRTDEYYNVWNAVAPQYFSLLLTFLFISFFIFFAFRVMTNYIDTNL